jgi:hypothetical protein
LSTIHGRNICKDRERTISILAIRSKKAACRRFSKQLLDIGDGKVTTDETGCIQLPTDFCTIIYSQDALIDQIFSIVHRQYTNHEWQAERAILVGSKKCGRRRFESQDKTFVTRKLGVIQIY